MKFIDKLIEETKQGILDYIWEFYGDDRFKYVAEKHPLKDLNFSLSDIVTKEEIKPSGKAKIVPDPTLGRIIFPNGAGLDVDRPKLEILNAECTLAIVRAMEDTADRYANGTIQKEIAQAKAKAEADKKNKEKSKEKPVNEKQEDKPKV
jgi:hypothetical protein